MNTERWRQRLGRTIGLAFIGWLALGAALPIEGAADDLPNGSALQAFDARAVASVGSFCFLAPQAVYPVQVCGGDLESTTIATSDPRGFAFGGIAPVPISSSIGLLVGEKDPILGLPIPEGVRAALQSFDFGNTPTQCMAKFPAVGEGDDRRTCGGPSVVDDDAGVKASAFNGVVRSQGDLGRPLSPQAEATSRASEVAVPQVKVVARNAYARSTSGVVTDGRASGAAEMSIDELILASGAVRFAGIRSTTTVLSDGTTEGSASSTSFVIGSAFVAGIPVIIDERGVHVADNHAPGPSLGEIAATVNKTLADAGGLSLRLIPPPEASKQFGRVVARSGGLQIRFNSATPTAVNITYDVGVTSAGVSAVPGAAFETAVPGAQTAPPESGSPDPAVPVQGTAPPGAAMIDAGGPLDGAVAPFGPGTAGGAAPFSTSSASDPAWTPGPAEGPPRVVPAVSSRGEPVAAVTVSPLDERKLRWLYLALFAVIAAALGCIRLSRSMTGRSGGSR